MGAAKRRSWWRGLEEGRAERDGGVVLRRDPCCRCINGEYLPFEERACGISEGLFCELYRKNAEC